MRKNQNGIRHGNYNNLPDALFVLKIVQMESLKGKKIIIVGATGGIGMATAKLLHGSQAKLFLTGRNRAQLDQLSAQFQGADTYVLDIADTDAIAAMASDYVRDHGAPDVLINAAGIGIIRPVEQLSVEEFIKTLQTNLTSVFTLVKSLLPSMKEAKRGLIINIPGVLGKVPMAGAAAYSASKYGLIGMMHCIREEVKRTDIRITNLILGGVDSPFWDNIDLRVQKEKMIRPEEAAKAIWFLCQQPVSGVVSEMVLQPFNHQAV
jgi:short-subunit dehydrogenase